MKGLWRAYVLSNVHISLCAVAFYYSGCNLVNVVVSPWVCLFLFSGSLCTYSLHRIISARKHSSPIAGHERFSYLGAIGKWKIGYLSLLTLISLFSFSMLPQQSRLYLAILSALSIGYIIPVLGSEKRLRDISLLKIFLIAFVWSGIFLLPASDFQVNKWNFAFLWLFLEKFIFIFALTLPFDIRDKELDASTQVSTFANILTIRQIKLLISISIIFCALLAVCLFYLGTYSLFLMIALLTFYGVQAVLSLRVTPKTSELYYLGVLDGLIIMQSLVIVLVSDL